MSTVLKLSLFLLISINAIADPDYQALGKPAKSLSHSTPFNLTITPDGKGLPIGKGTAEQGAKLFQQKCASCHGPNAIGASADPLVGEVGSLQSAYPEKTVNSYWPYATTLFDYIRRTMPINAPFSLTADEVYSLCAYILSQDAIIEKSTELNEENLSKIIMPNRQGFISLYPNQ